MIRLVHILGAVMFLGGIMASIIWMVLATRTKKPEVIKFAINSVTVVDMIFSNPGAFLLIPTGFLLAGSFKQIIDTSWLALSLTLVNLAGVVYLAFCLRYQLKLARMANGMEEGLNFSSEFTDMLNKWFLWAIIATVLIVIPLFLMVFKPTLW